MVDLPYVSNGIAVGLSGIFKFHVSGHRYGAREFWNCDYITVHVPSSQIQGTFPDRHADAFNLAARDNYPIHRVNFARAELVVSIASLGRFGNSPFWLNAISLFNFRRSSINTKPNVTIFHSIIRINRWSRATVRLWLVLKQPSVVSWKQMTQNTAVRLTLLTSPRAVVRPWVPHAVSLINKAWPSLLILWLVSTAVSDFNIIDIINRSGATMPQPLLDLDETPEQVQDWWGLSGDLASAGNWWQYRSCGQILIGNRESVSWQNKSSSFLI